VREMEIEERETEEGMRRRIYRRIQGGERKRG
jgi:hypothetical protein